MRTARYPVKYVSGGINVYSQTDKLMKLDADGIRLEMMFGKEKDLFTWEQIQSVEVDTETENKRISFGKALGGGIIFGPIGAVLGGVSGTKKSHTSMHISYLTASNVQKVLIITLSANQANKIKQEIDKVLTERFGTSERNTAENTESIGSDRDILGSLERLSKLRKDGVLSESEFESQKNKLLNK